ncbi:GNAT family N-acetyltransferase [Cohnella pontilimi]|uniref:GNAT family N-acetyltransferase n=1 Tax=Cohnella pontilimi TaxID=2564100 RepID=A0A4U0F880_9BACL|nr:GNAT family N-acetyltransferase [Cohnella pontilimi]TJY40831.1 GNAT family N-acetyltransferase [Cohnella pontilimi]
MSMPSQDVEIVYEVPAPEEYVAIRDRAGMSGKEVAAAEIGLRHSLHCVALRKEGRLIGMGRVIGDGGCFFQVVDVVVDPDHQGRGLGKLIMSEINKYLNEHAPKSAYVSLIADVPADKLYQQFGFLYTAPKSLGMYKRY